MRYDKDSRVRKCGRGYKVDTDGGEYQVLPNDVMGWGIFTGQHLNLVPVKGGGFAIGYRSAEQAIADLIGEPRSASRP